jgi:hypothetical protein
MRAGDVFSCREVARIFFAANICCILLVTLLSFEKKKNRRHYSVVIHHAVSVLTWAAAPEAQGYGFA